MPLYYLVNTKDGSYWDGSYRYRVTQQFADDNSPTYKANKGFVLGFRDRPRFFATAAALWSSLNKAPKAFARAFLKDNPKPPQKRDHRGHAIWDREHGDWSEKRYHAYPTWIKAHRYSSVDLLKMVAKDHGWKVYVTPNGEGLSQGKPL